MFKNGFETQSIAFLCEQAGCCAEKAFDFGRGGGSIENNRGYFLKSRKRLFVGLEKFDWAIRIIVGVFFTISSEP